MLRRLFGRKEQPKPEEVQQQLAQQQQEEQERVEESLQRTRRGAFGDIFNLFKGKEVAAEPITEELFEELEMLLYSADLGPQTVDEVQYVLRKRYQDAKLTTRPQLYDTLKEVLTEVLQEGYEPIKARWEAWMQPGYQPPDPVDESLPMSEEQFREAAKKLHVILVIGVNGVGKTTTIAKLANYLQNRGEKVVLAAGDTFRAAAIEQLQVWGERLGVEVVAQKQGSDPGAVVHDACNRAVNLRADTLIIDTAGRLHNKANLMEELRKIYKVAGRIVPDAPHETLLIIDATTGQNGLTQAKAFAEIAKLTGVVVAKLDGTAKGGIAFAISRNVGVPIRYIGTGEKMTDLAEFNPRQFVNALFG